MASKYGFRDTEWLCSQSDWLQETRDCVVRLPEDDPKAVARVIYYCYSGEAEMDSEFYEYFDFEESDPAELVTEARCIIDAYLTADKLLVSNLAQQLWESLRCRLLHAEIAAKLAEINSILRYVYAECPDRRIRLLVVYFTISAMKRAQASLDYLKQPLDKIPGFAWDYVRMDKFITSHDMVCTVCKKTFGLARTGYCKCGGLGFCCNYCSITHEACPYCKAPASIW